MSKITDSIQRKKDLDELNILRQSLTLDDKLRELYGWSNEMFQSITRAKQNRVRELEDFLNKN